MVPPPDEKGGTRTEPEPSDVSRTTSTVESHYSVTSPALSPRSSISEHIPLPFWAREIALSLHARPSMNKPEFTSERDGSFASYSISFFFVVACLLIDLQVEPRALSPPGQGPAPPRSRTTLAVLIFDLETELSESTAMAPGSLLTCTWMIVSSPSSSKHASFKPDQTICLRIRNLLERLLASMMTNFPGRVLTSSSACLLPTTNCSERFTRWLQSGTRRIAD